MKKSEKFLSVLERRAAREARKAEQTLQQGCFIMRYHLLYWLSALPWTVICLALAVALHLLDVLYLAVICDVMAAALGYLLLDWLTWRAKVNEEGIIVKRFGVTCRRLNWTELGQVRLQGEKTSDSKTMILMGGKKPLRFVSEMIGFELLHQMAQKKMK